MAGDTKNSVDSTFAVAEAFRGEMYSTLAELLRLRSAQDRERLGYVFLGDGETETAQLTYRELEARARVIAAVMARYQAAGALALLLHPAGLDIVAAFFGCLHARAVAAPAYPLHPARLARRLPRLMAIIADAGPTWLLTTAALLPIAEDHHRRAESSPRGHRGDGRAVVWPDTERPRKRSRQGVARSCDSA